MPLFRYNRLQAQTRAMHLTIYLAPLVCLIGLLLFIVAAGNWKRVGEIMFFCGLLATLLLFPGEGQLTSGAARTGSSQRN